MTTLCVSKSEREKSEKQDHNEKFVATASSVLRLTLFTELRIMQSVLLACTHDQCCYCMLAMIYIANRVQAAIAKRDTVRTIGSPSAAVQQQLQQQQQQQQQQQPRAASAYSNGNSSNGDNSSSVSPTSSNRNAYSAGGIELPPVKQQQQQKQQQKQQQQPSLPQQYHLSDNTNNSSSSSTSSGHRPRGSQGYASIQPVKVSPDLLCNIANLLVLYSMSTTCTQITSVCMPQGNAWFAVL
eukprot:17578-Heterococcus_DN1.PRE.6